MAFLVVVSAWTQGQSQPGVSVGQAMSRPPLQGHQGRYFRWSAPIGWRVSEATNGVTLRSSDGKTKTKEKTVWGQAWDIAIWFHP